jgi:hypothetical protein
MRPAKRWSSADLDAVIERVTPDVLTLLGDGVPRAEAAIVAALAGRHLKDDVKLTVMRLAVLGQLAMRGTRYHMRSAIRWRCSSSGCRRTMTSIGTSRSASTPRIRPSSRTGR